MEQLVITRMSISNIDYAFANARDPAHVELAARILEADGYTISIMTRRLDDGTSIYALTATRQRYEVRQ